MTTLQGFVLLTVFGLGACSSGSTGGTRTPTEDAGSGDSVRATGGSGGAAESSGGLSGTGGAVDGNGGALLGAGGITGSGSSNGAGGITGTGGLASAGGSGGFGFVFGSDSGTEPEACQGASPNPEPPLVACSLVLSPAPGGAPFNLNFLNVAYTSGSGPATFIPKIDGAGFCSLNQNQAWYFDNPTSPAKVTLCAGSCSLAPAATFKLLYGCAMIVGKTQ